MPSWIFKPLILVTVLSGMVWPECGYGKGWLSLTLTHPTTKKVTWKGRVEPVHTPQDVARGLMGRQQLAAEKGMLFFFTPPRRVAFWMKNTLIPLDIIFMRHNTVIAIDHNRQPHDLRSHGPQEPVDLVLEIPGGVAKKRGIQVGNHLKLTPKSFPEQHFQNLYL